MAGRKSKSAYYPALAMLVLVVAIIGFSKTFFAPLFAGTFAASAIIWVHASLMFSWVVLFMAQAMLIRTGNFKWHQRMGAIGASLVVLIIPFTIATGASVLPRDLANMGEAGYSAFLPVIIEAFLFGGLVSTAIWLRKRPDYHKRLMLLATLSALGPAWFRFRHFFPQVENPVVVFAFWLAIVPMFAAAILDAWQSRRVHPVFLYVLPGIIVVYIIEVWGSSHPWFVSAAKFMAALLGHDDTPS